MAWQQSDLDTLDKAIANNLRSVTFADGRQTTFQDADKMLQVRTAMKDELADAAARARPRLRTTIGRVCRQ